MRVVVLVWEGLLGILTIVLIVAALLSGPSGYLVNVLAQAGPLGLVATGLALSFRTGTPNLAVGSIAAFTGMVTATLMSGQGWLAAIIAVLVATLGGLVLGLFVAALSAPAWAVTLGAAVACEALVIGIADARVIPIELGGDFPAYVWFVLFVIVSLGGALAWPALRVESPWIAGLVGVGGSSLLAALGGVALLIRIHAASPGLGWNTTTLAFAAILLGGISVHGKRGGVAGTVLAVLFLSLVQGQLVLWAVPLWVFQVITGAVILAALLAGRLAELAAPETPAPVLSGGRI